MGLLAAILLGLLYINEKLTVAISSLLLFASFKVRKVAISVEDQRQVFGLLALSFDSCRLSPPILRCVNRRGIAMDDDVKPMVFSLSIESLTRFCFVDTAIDERPRR